MSINDQLVSYTKRSDGRIDITYDGEPILVLRELPTSEFFVNALRILIERHLVELGDGERLRYYQRSEAAAE